MPLLIILSLYQIGAEIKDFDAVPYFKDRKSAVRNDRVTLLGMAASRLAVDDAKLDTSTVVPGKSFHSSSHPPSSFWRHIVSCSSLWLTVSRIHNTEKLGVIVGSAFGGLATLEAQIKEQERSGPAKVSPLAIPMLLSNLISGTIAIELGAKGPNFGEWSILFIADGGVKWLTDWLTVGCVPCTYTVVNTACAAATHALGLAYNSIAKGEADVILAGGAEAAVTPFGYGGFCSMRAMATKFNDQPTKVHAYIHTHINILSDYFVKVMAAKRVLSLLALYIYIHTSL